MSEAMRFSIEKAPFAVPERILVRPTKVAPCWDRICSRERSCFAIAWQNSIRVHVGCACGVKHTRGWPGEAGDANMHFLATVMCLPYIQQHTARELSRET